MNKYSYNLRELSQMSGLSVDTIRRAVHRLDLPASKPTPGKVVVRAADFEKWFKKGEIK